MISQRHVSNGKQRTGVLSRRQHTLRIAVVVTSTWMALLSFHAVADAPAKITSEVAKVDDLAAEIRSLVTGQESLAASDATYSENRDRVRRQSIQIAILAQALAEHESDSELKSKAPATRDHALSLSRSKTYTEAQSDLAALRAALEKQSDASHTQYVDWNRLGSTGMMMSILKERSELVRKGFRRPKDPAAESRNAMMMGLAAFVVHADKRNFKSPADKSDWQQACLDVQRHMSKSAAAIRDQDQPTAATEFRAAMETCDRCHEKFKP